MIRFLAPQVKADHRTLTVDFAGSGGSLENLAGVGYTVRDADGRAVTTGFAVVSGVGSSATLFLLITPASVFPDYDGSKDTLSAVLTTTSAITWGSNGVGPRIIKYKSDFSQNGDIFGFSSADGTNRLIGANITGATSGTYVTSGLYDCRALGGTFSTGSQTAGWTDTPPTQGVQITPAATEDRRATSVIATQTEAGLLDLGTGDVMAIGLGSIVGALTGTCSQSATGVTFGLGTSSMECRYLYLHHVKGRE